MFTFGSRHKPLTGFPDVLESEAEAREIFTQAVGMLLLFFPSREIANKALPAALAVAC
ncbi:hypothetical protein [Rhizobium esperanzae]|uniref:Uncharacterized protein n=1 Tax=Rhizobium esperanzae TaxID=1967781 RepID=A0A7W6W7P1_9HYPH|nr:hypothetical protein [Rhizobium esperanzae]MBB4238918.1 hypothetical protein [Rhizobium esperanzae]